MKSGGYHSKLSGSVGNSITIQEYFETVIGDTHDKSAGLNQFYYSEGTN